MTGRQVFATGMVSMVLVGHAACAGVPSTGSAPQATPAATAVDRQSRIPAQASKMGPDTDEHPPLVTSSGFEPPVPVPGLVNTAGGEDSPFILPNGNTLYFFFTPDVSVPVEQQVVDGVTGIYVSRMKDGTWDAPDRVLLEPPGTAAGDGCEFVQGDVMWFCSVREGYTGIHWFTAHQVDGLWGDIHLADFDPSYQVGELHISGDGRQLYFGSQRPGGHGGLDIWVSNLANGDWQEPENIAAVNTPDNEGWPALNPAGDELWFTRNYGVWRSMKAGDTWGEPKLVISPLAGEPSIDTAGNVYFVHHYYHADTMIEADIYVAYRR